MKTYSDHIARVSTALADPTRREIMEHVIGADSPLSVREVADHFGLHSNAVRIHLDKLVKGGLLQVVRRRGERGGRPANLYGASEDDLEINLPPRHYKLLAEVLVRGIPEEAGEIVRRLGGEAYRRGREEAMMTSSPLALVARDASVEEVAEAWSDEIRKRGHRARMVTVQGGVEMTFITCPFGEFSRSRPSLVCEIHRRMEEGFLSLACPCSLALTGKKCVFVLEGGGNSGRGG